VNTLPDGMPASSDDISPGDVVTLRKPHPCGSTDWQVTRVGADIGLRCLGCARVVLLPRHEFRMRVKGIRRQSGEQTDT
jgi:hypothetical protein